MRDGDLMRMRDARSETATCAAKKFFPSEAAARAFGDDCWRRYRTKQRPYQCRVCRGWHLQHVHTFEPDGPGWSACGCGWRRRA